MDFLNCLRIQEAERECILPRDLLEEVLLRVPAKLVFRFRQVSKTWKNIIDSPEFIKQHFKRSSSRPSLLLEAMAMRSSPYMICDAGSLESPEKMKAAAKLYYSLKKSKHKISRYIDIIGTCNGLIFLTLPEFFIYGYYQPPPCVLWNPCTHRILRLPCAPVNVPKDGFCQYSHGLGYDEGHDDHKVVRVVRFYTLDGELSMREDVDVYSLKSNRWRKLTDQFPSKHLSRDRCVPFNGALHWHSEVPDAIVALNLTTEKYHLISAPDQKGYIDDLGVYDGCLALWISFVPCPGELSDMWIMKQYGVWTKLNLQLPPPKVLYWRCWKPVASYCNHRYVVFQNGPYLLRYDTENKLCDDIVSVDDSPDIVSGMICFVRGGIAFVPSLVKLPGGTSEASLLAASRKPNTGLCSRLRSLYRRLNSATKYSVEFLNSFS